MNKLSKQKLCIRHSLQLASLDKTSWLQLQSVMILLI